MIPFPRPVLSVLFVLPILLTIFFLWSFLLAPIGIIQSIIILTLPLQSSSSSLSYSLLLSCFRILLALCQSLIGIFFLLPPFLMKYVGGTKFIYQTNKKSFPLLSSTSESSSSSSSLPSTLVLSTHPTDIDWLFLFSPLSTLPPFDISKLKIVMKASIASFPLVGPSLSQVFHLFFDRKWENDKINILNTLQFYYSLSLPHHLLIFPEGSDLAEPKSKRKSDEFQKSIGRGEGKGQLPLYQNVLYPRVTGGKAIFNVMRGRTIESKSEKVGESRNDWDNNNKNNNISNVWDFTIGFPGHRIYKLTQMIKGDFPSHVTLFINHYKAEDVDTYTYKGNEKDNGRDKSSKEGMEGFILDLFERKEEVLKAFYEKSEKRKKEGGDAGKVKFDNIDIIGDKIIENKESDVTITLSPPLSVILYKDIVPLSLLIFVLSLTIYSLIHPWILVYCVCMIGFYSITGISKKIFREKIGTF